MNTDEVPVYTVRPGGTSLWLPNWLAVMLHIRHGDHLSQEQFESERIQELIRLRLKNESKPKLK